ncbi:hypothetical protein [Nonomuraea sp. NPDC049684]|uniref:hypothetical protein n=1 Tax=Nonomuraea sp. NPDC049684 TaxID=3364356 RepID=UPI0037B22598
MPTEHTATSSAGPRQRSARSSWASPSWPAPRTPAHAAGGCADRSQNGWTIRLCASKNGLDLISDMYVITKGQTGNGCRGEGHATSSGRPMGHLDLTGCADIAVNTRYAIASQWAAGGAQVTTRAVIFESLSPFRALFDQSASFSDV